MNPNYFYDLAYISPYGAQMYEYSQHDPENRIDFATFYHEDMWTSGLLTDDSRDLLNIYQTIPTNGYPNTTMGLEWDCGSVKPALFARLHQTDEQLNSSIYTAVAGVVGLGSSTQPVLPQYIKAEDIGIYPERGNGIVRYLVRGEWSALKNFALSAGAQRASSLSDNMIGTTQWNTGISFDWNGAAMSNFTLHSTILEQDNSWVQQSLAHCKERVSVIFSEHRYTISQFVKIGLSDSFADNYMKAYFTVRIVK